MNYTPGPWSIEGSPDENMSIVNRDYPGYHWDICTVHGSTANARLIAAAPEMVQALKDILTANDDAILLRKQDAECECPYGSSFRKYLESIIAKAEGK